MVQLFGRAEAERLRAGALFPCPSCGDVRRSDVVRTRPTLRVVGVPIPFGSDVESMRCQTCRASYEPMVDGRMNLRQVSEWNHRVARLVATVGLAAGAGQVLRRRFAAHELLLERGFFTADADAVVGWAAEVCDDALPALVDELVIALDIVREVMSPAAMALEVCSLAAVLAADGIVDVRCQDVLARCCEAARVDPAALEDVMRAVRVERRALAA
jgi:hypothetical protein